MTNAIKVLLQIQSGFLQLESTLGTYLAIIYVVDSSCTLNIIQSVYKRTYIKSPVELCGSIFFLAALRRVVEADKLVVK
jgi:hypothetical protein